MVSVHTTSGIGHASDRRMAPRAPLRAELVVREIRSKTVSPAVRAMTVNVSATGIGLESATPLPVGCHYMVDAWSGSRGLDGPVRVVTCRRLGTGSYAIGAERYSRSSVPRVTPN